MDLGTLGFFLQEHHFKNYGPKLISNEKNLKGKFDAKSFKNDKLFELKLLKIR